MKKEQTVGIERNLVNLVKEIDNNLEFVKPLGIGGYGRVLKVKKGDKSYRLKVNKNNNIDGRHDTLEREYSILEDLSEKTDVVPKAVRFYDDAPCLYGTVKGKNAYLTEFIEGEVLSKAEDQLSEISLRLALSEMVKNIHKAGYKFSKDADLNADNILLDRNGKLYLIDPMFLVPLKEKLPFGMTKEERARINEIVRRYSFKGG